MSFFAASIFLKALGWALVNSLWQFAICWLLYRSLTAGLTKLTAAARHSIALLSLFSGTGWFMVNLIQNYYTHLAASDTLFFVPVAANVYFATVWQAAGDRMDALMPWWSVLYLVCIAFLFIKLNLFVRRATRLQKNDVTKINGRWRTYIKTISAQLGIQREVKALLSIHIDTPQVIGFLKPVILLPAACLTSLTTAQLEAVLLHELVHIKRNDYIVNFLVASLEILFFFNPFVKQLAAGIRKEREYSCDDMVIQFQHPPHEYATALLTLEKCRLLPVTYGIAAAGKNQQQLLTRIQRILGIKDRETGAYRLAACLLALFFICLMVSIKPSKMAIDKFGSAGLALAANNITNLQYNDEAAGKLRNLLTPAAIKVLPGVKVQSGPPAPATEKYRELPTAAPTISMQENDDNTGPNPENIQVASDREAIDFSLQQLEATAAVEIPEALTAVPYVPANSFSYQFFQDSSIPKVKGQTYNERVAKDAVVKAQKALAQIDWLKIEKQLKYKSQDMAKLKKELAAQIQSLNWQKISRETQSEASQGQLNKLREAVHLDQTIQQYRQTEAYYEALQRQMAEQEQLLKASENRMQESQKAAAEQQKKLQQEMKKRRIVYI
jgi:beta-lactamase regulating signal transducer with metallopeptidase domain